MKEEQTRPARRDRRAHGPARPLPEEILRGRLFGLAYRMLGSRADAEDIVQEARVRWHEAAPGSRVALVRARPTGRGGCDRVGNCIDQCRRDVVPHAGDDAKVGGGNRGRDVAAGFDWHEGVLRAVLQDQERASAVRQAVLTLPPRYREPIVVYYFEEMNLADTARVLGLPEGTVKARLHRGRELLKRRAAARGRM